MRDYIKFPVFNIGYETWYLDVLGDFFLYDDVYKGNDAFFEKYYLNQDFVDCNGNLFKITGKYPIKRSFFWNRKKSRLVFEYLGKRLELIELKNKLLERTSQIEDPMANAALIRQIKESKTIEEMLVGGSE